MSAWRRSGLVQGLALAGVYFASARLGLSLSTVSGSVSPVWPPTGVALAGLLLLGVSRWPAIFLSMFAASWLNDAPLLTTLGIATGNTLEAVLGALVLQRVGFSRELARVRDVVALGLGMAVCTWVSTAMGTVSLWLGGVLPLEGFAHAAWVWWVGDLMGAWVVAPLLLLWLEGRWTRPSREAWVLAGLTGLMCVAVFLTGRVHSNTHATAFLLFPLSAWAALRFGPRGAVTATLLMSSAAIVGTARRLGPFTSGDVTEDLLVLQLFVGVTSLTSMLLAASTAEKRRAAEQLELLATTVRGVHEGVLISEVVTPGELRAVFANEAFCELLGRKPEDLLGRSPHALHEAADEDSQRHIMEALCEGRSVRAEVSLSRPDGGRVRSEMQLSPVRATGAEVTHFVATHRDVTATQELQSRLVAAERVAAVGMLAAGVGHEINNPLAYLVLNLEAAVRSLGEGSLPGMRDALGSVRGALEGAERIRLIVKDLRVFSRQGDPDRALVDLNALVPPAVRIISHALRHRARLVEEFGPVPKVLGSEARLGQVLLNLLVNAMQAIPQGTPALNEVRVRTSTDASGRARVDVSDTGSGIPAQVLSRIFDPFFSTKASGEGQGLGLAICQQIVRAHGGELQVSSEPGAGSVFTMLLPAAPAQTSMVSRPGARSHGALESSRLTSGGRRGRVLIVDDEPRLAQSMRLLLEPYHDVVTTTRGSEAMALVSAGHRFDMVLCDLQMPETDGIGVYRHLASMAPALAARLVFISGGAYTPAARDFLTEVPNRVLEKPVRPEVLLAAVEAALTGEPTAHDSTGVAVGARH
ncbi:histidine kinase [Corallococcus sp. H22C18031201]|uniref:MASE1 domain-containing protein n=1 Tax=Citreicoccus inhibens TaxID=2849499 RepID=UPI000E721BF9|nr:MASE1 domain-containing protein [Citreicoccus inhibens]MBU8898048.1 MASE1 domain-containing protein [Citreicoccus inhibens]RJS15759.1 histidine kinase [Corallococcus sp. H22C18031201]